MASVFERVKKVLNKQLNVDEDQITKDAFFIDDLGADSIDSVELIMDFEAEFKIDIPEEDAENFQRVNDVVIYVESRIFIMLHYKNILALRYKMIS